MVVLTALEEDIRKRKHNREIRARQQGAQEQGGKTRSLRYAKYGTGKQNKGDRKRWWRRMAKAVSKLI